MRTKTAIKIGAVVAMVAAAWWARDAIDVDAMRTWIAGFGVWGALVFGVIYAALTPLMFPGTLLTLAAGALFGPWFGGFVALTGATVGASIAFVIARNLAGDWVRRKTGPRLGSLIEGVDRQGWRFVALVRLVPLAPFNVLNFALGLTSIPLSVYAVTSYITMAPGAVAYAWLGAAGASAASGDQDAVRNGLIALSLVASVALIPPLVKAMRRTRAAPETTG